MGFQLSKTVSDPIVDLDGAFSKIVNGFTNAVYYTLRIPILDVKQSSEYAYEVDGYFLKSPK